MPLPPGPPPRAVVFDVFGTLAEITDRRRPFARLLRHAQRSGRRPQPEDAALLMSRPVDLAGAAQLFGVAVPARDLQGLELDLTAELRSVRLFPEVRATLTALRKRGIPVALCSNLAAPYAAPIQALLSSLTDVQVWSFECGAVKPQPTIYRRVCMALACEPGEVLMVGDTYSADVAGPQQFGMHAALLDRHGRAPQRSPLRSLTEVLPLVQAP